MFLTAAVRNFAGLMCLLLLLFPSCRDVFAANNARGDKAEGTLQGDWGKISLNVRYRFEYVEQDGLETASGDPVRIRLGYQSPMISDLQAYVEVLGNTPIFLDDYNDTSNGKTEYATIGDPNEAALNQAWLSYSKIPGTIIKGGRQTIIWDNQRFVCPAAWRQMGQTFDAVTMENSSLGNFSVKAAYLWNVLTTGNQQVRMQSPLLNIKYTLSGTGSVITYGYWLDYSNPDDSGPSPYAYSSQTYGLRFNGSPAVTDSLHLLYTLEYASQSEYQENPENFTADYYSVILGLRAPGNSSFWKDISGQVGYEVFGSDNGVSFMTPLGANHRYNGWADIFGKTKPDSGLRDYYGSVSAKVYGVKMDLAYHDFHADAGGSDYGTEIDIKLTKKIWKNYEVLASYSSYNADEYKGDTRKFWMQITAEF